MIGASRLPEREVACRLGSSIIKIASSKAATGLRDGSNMDLLERIARIESNGYFETDAKHDPLERGGKCPERFRDADALKPGGPIAEVVTKRLKSMFETATQSNNNKRRRVVQFVIHTADYVPLQADGLFATKGLACNSLSCTLG